MPSNRSTYLEDIELPGHRGRPDMDDRERHWLVDPANRDVVLRLWRRLRDVSPSLLGGYGILTSEQLEDDGVPETLVAHWRSIEYGEQGERIEWVPGGMIARDLNRLGLKFSDVAAGSVVAPLPRPQPQPRQTARVIGPQAVAVKPVVIRRRGKGATNER